MGGRPSQRVAVGYVVRAKGVRGAVKVEPLTHRLARFDELDSVVLQRVGSEDLPLRIESWRRDTPGVQVKFVGINSPEDAKERLAGGYLTVAADEVAALPEDTYYVFELVGCEVVDESGRRLGQIAEVLQLPSADVYAVRDGDREHLIPAVGDFVVEVCVPERRMVVRGVDELVETR